MSPPRPRTVTCTQVCERGFKWRGPASKAKWGGCRLSRKRGLALASLDLNACNCAHFAHPPLDTAEISKWCQRVASLQHGHDAPRGSAGIEFLYASFLIRSFQQTGENTRQYQHLSPNQNRMAPYMVPFFEFFFFALRRLQSGHCRKGIFGWNSSNNQKVCQNPSEFAKSVFLWNERIEIKIHRFDFARP